MDASGIFLLKDLYVSFMSGNTTSLGGALGRADWGRAGFIAGIVAVFVLGAAAGTVLAHVAGRYRLPAVVLAVSAVLVVPLVSAGFAAWAMIFGMGALNAAMQEAGPVKVSVTYVTGTLVKFGQGLGRMVCGTSNDNGWVAQTVPWFGLLAGAAIAALSLSRFGVLAFAGLPVAGGLITAGAWASLPR